MNTSEEIPTERSLAMPACLPRNRCAMIAGGAAAFASHCFSSDVGVYLHSGKSAESQCERCRKVKGSCAGMVQAAVGVYFM